MSLLLTEKEIAVAQTVLERLEGLTLHEVENVMAQVHGKLLLARSRLQDQLMFRPEGVGNHG